VYCYYLQQQYSGTSISITSQVVSTDVSSLSFSFPSCHPSCLPPFIGHYFFPLFLACSKEIKMGLINSKRTSVCLANVDVIKDLILLPLSLFHPSPGLNHPHFYYIPYPIIIYRAKSPQKFIKLSSLRLVFCVFLDFMNFYRSSPT